MPRPQSGLCHARLEPAALHGSWPSAESHTEEVGGGGREGEGEGGGGRGREASE